MKIAIFGGTSFIGQALTENLKHAGNTVIAISNRKTNLRDPIVRKRLLHRLKGSDAFISCMMIKPPTHLPKEEGWRGVRDDNLRLIESLIGLVNKTGRLHTLYLSSDAVYPYLPEPVSETTPVAPFSEYAQTHVAAEDMLSDALGDGLTICRLTQVYGLNDPHNAYGPCQMIRSALKSGQIQLFGNGEEYRDHIGIESVVFYLSKLLERRVRGLVNVASGKSVTFQAIADTLTKLIPGVMIEHCERKVPLVHRHVDVSQLHSLVPEHKETGLLKDLPDLLAQFRDAFQN